MTRITRTSVARLSALPGYRNLLATMGRIKKEGKGNSFLEPFTDEKTFSEFQSRVDELAYGLDEVLDEMERSNRAKATPFDRSGYAEWSENVHDYYQDPGKVSVYSEAVETEILDNILNYFDYHRFTANLTPLTFESGLKQSRKNTNLGLPHMTSNWSNRNVLSEYVGRGRKLFEGKRMRLNPFVLFVRVQQGKSVGENKIRPVWGSDHAETFGCLPFLVPLIENMRKHAGMSAWLGIDGVAANVASWRRPLSDGVTYLSGDISRMDQSVHEADLRIAFRAMQHLISIPPLLVEQLIEHYTFGELVTPEGILAGRHGLPSGVAFTNMVDTLVVLGKSVTAMTRLGYSVSDIIGEWHGDDFVVQIENSKARDFIEIMNELGVTVSDDSSKTLQDGERFQYLQRLWTPHLDAVYPLHRIAARLVHSERFITQVSSREGETTEFDKSIRMLQIYSKLENGRNHPRFYDFVKLVGKYDRFQLSPEIISDKWRFLEGVVGYASRPTEGSSGGLEATATFRTVMELRRNGELSPQTGV